MKKLLIVTAFVIIVTGCAKQKNENNASIFSLPQEFWDVYLEQLSYENSDGIPYDSMQENGKDYVNYFIQATHVISICYGYYNGDLGENELKIAEEKMGLMINTFEEHQCFPRPEYATAAYEYGWVSSMDAPSIMVAARMLYEITDNNKYEKFINELSDYVIKTTEEGGFNYIISKNEIWPLEYARLTSDDETNMYVLNGSLVGYISMKAMYSIGCFNKKAYLEKIENAYKNKEFHYNDNNWTYYMLNPKTVIPVHYLIFEKKLFAAAYSLNNDYYFKEEELYREGLLKKVLRVEFYREKPDAITYYMLRGSSPNEYQIDTYKTKIEFLDENKVIIEDAINEVYGEFGEDVNGFYDGLFMTGELKNDKIKYYRVYSNNNSGWYLLFESEVQICNNSEVNRLDIKEIKAARDAVLDGRKLKLKPELSQEKEGDIKIILNNSDKLSEYIYSIELNNTSKHEINAGIILYDADGNGAGRYYPTLLPGKNLVLFDTNGIAESPNLKNISEIWIRLYESDFDDTNVVIGDLYYFDHYDCLWKYVYATEYKIHPQ